MSCSMFKYLELSVGQSTVVLSGVLLVLIFVCGGGGVSRAEGGNLVMPESSHL
jgi:hypothetical protein